MGDKSGKTVIEMNGFTKKRKNFKIGWKRRGQTPTAQQLSLTWQRGELRRRGRRNHNKFRFA